MVPHLVVRMVPHLVDVVQQACPSTLLPDDPTWTDGDDIPPLPSFVESVIREFCIDVTTLVVTVIYLRRLQSHYSGKRPISYPSTAHRIFLASAMMAFKYLDDDAHNNREWTGYIFVPEYEEFWFSLPQVNTMETQLLETLDWKLNVTPEEFGSHLLEAYCSLLWQFEEAKGSGKPADEARRAKRVKLQRGGQDA